MFNKNDKSLYLVRKIVNILLFVLMCVSVIAGIVLIAMSFYTYKEEIFVNFITLISGVCTMILGPVLLQLVYLVADIGFNALLDVKIIRNAQFGIDVPEFSAPLFFTNKKENVMGTNTLDVYEKLKKYKALFDESVITIDEYENIKNGLLQKNIQTVETIDDDISKVKRLKTLADEKVLSEEEFALEKSKILKK